MYKYTLVLLISFGVCAADNQQNGDLNTNTQDSTVNSNNNTENVTKNFNGAGSGTSMPVTSAIAPSLMSSGNDTCLRSETGGMQLALIGVSTGKYHQDLECNRRKDAKTLRELGMSVASVSLMCQKIEVWMAMFTAGTPCPLLVNAKLVVGRNAYLVMRQNPTIHIPDYLQRKVYYNTVLGIGVEVSNEEVSTLSISERFRSSVRD